MCSGVNFTNGTSHYFGRNLDWQTFYPVSVVVTPRNYHFQFRNCPDVDSHYAMIGMSLIENNYPLYFDGMNEKGLGMAGLAFFGYAKFFPVEEGKTNVASFEILPYILAKCATVEEAKAELANMNITDAAFAPGMPPSELHWIIGDKDGSIVVESQADGLHVYDNPFNVLTNCPNFDFMRQNLSWFINITGSTVPIRFAKDTTGLKEYSRGMGTIGLPGGSDSVSRFVHLAFTRANMICENKDSVNVAEFFHLLGSVQQVSGESEIDPGQYEVTQYSSCGDQDTGTYYYTTYLNPNLYGVCMFNEDLDGQALITYPVANELEPIIQNPKK